MAMGVAASVMAVGTLMSYEAQKEQAAAQEEQAAREDAYAKYKAKQVRRNAGQVKASAQRGAEKERLQTDLVKSRAQAIMAAQGGASDPGSMRIIADIEREGANREAIAIYQGETEAQAMEEQATGLEIGGAIALQGGREAASATRMQAVGTVMSGAASVYNLYNK
jgi:hypothetical protein